MKKKETLQNGITLISLVITIIILLILAGVAINMAVNSNGLFKRAEYAVETWNDSVADESVAIENAMLIMDEVGGVKVTLEPTSLSIKEKETGLITATIDSPNATNKTITWSTKDEQIATVQGNGTTAEITAVSEGITEITATCGDKSATCKVVVNWNIETVEDIVKEEKEDGTVRKAPIPKGYTVSQVTGENTIEDGLVIYEVENPVTETKGSPEHENAMKTRNQYVWIPVDDINSMIMCQECGAKGTITFKDNTLQCNTHGDATKLAGKLYATYLGEIFNSTLTDQKYTKSSGLHEPNTVSDDGVNSSGIGTASAFLAHLQEEFSNMAKSVAKYKGFYIGRYETQAGAASKKGANVLNADSSSANMWYGLYTTIQNSTTPESTVAQMIWGSQYDQVMLFALEKERKDGTGVTFDVQTVSTTRKRSSVEKSGNNPADLLCNIYDLEHNYFEWTAEAGDTNSRVTRGGTYYYAWSASTRDTVGDYPKFAAYDCTSRTTLYVAL